MSLDAPDAQGREAIATLLVKGWCVDDVVERLHYSRFWVSRIRQNLLQARRVAPARGGEEYAPWVHPHSRAAALERGRALAAAKVAAGEWVLPRDEVAR